MDPKQVQDDMRIFEAFFEGPQIHLIFKLIILKPNIFNSASSHGKENYRT